MDFSFGNFLLVSGLSLVAVAADGAIVGQCLTTQGTLVAADGSTRPILALGPIAVAYAFKIIGVTNTAPGQRPVVTYSITKGGAPVDVSTATRLPRSLRPVASAAGMSSRSPKARLARSWICRSACSSMSLIRARSRRCRERSST